MTNPRPHRWHRRDVLASACAAAAVPLASTSTASASLGAALLRAVPSSPSASVARWDPAAARFVKARPGHDPDITTAATLTVLAAQLASDPAPNTPTQSLALDIIFPTAHGNRTVHAFRADNRFSRVASVPTAMRTPITASRLISLGVSSGPAPASKATIALPARAGTYAIAAALPRWRTLTLNLDNDTPTLTNTQNHTPPFAHIILSVGAIK